MWSFLIRRSAYSLLIVLGVVLLTFLLFNVAAGDPVAAVLGKDPKPQAVEALRREMGADLPVLWGTRCRTEAYASFDAAKPLPDGVARRDGTWMCAARLQQTGCIGFAVEPAAAVVTAENAERQTDGTFRVTDSTRPVAVKGEGELRINFFRIQDNPANSQFRRALGEIISFSAAFPYVKVLDFGYTLTTREPIGKILRRGVVPSLSLMLPVMLGELLLGVALALVAAACKDGWPDRLLVMASVAGMSVSYLVLIIFAQWFLGYYCNFFPVWGWGDARYLLLPVAVGIFSGLGGNVRFYRTVFIDELKREYLRTAAAKGCAPWRIYGVHLLRNSAIPIITRVSAALPFLFTGSLLLETFFGIPGLGFASIDALNNSDLQLLKALVTVSALLFVVLNLLADLAYAWADPRIRLE